MLAGTFLCIALSYAQKKTQPAPPVTSSAEEVLYSQLKYRSIGPYRGGRSGAVTGSYKNKTTFYMGATGGGYGKQVMEGVTGKTSVISILAHPLVPLLLRQVMKMFFTLAKGKIPCGVM